MDWIARYVSTFLFFSIVRVTTPVLLAALGGMITEFAGVLNIGLEGMMLFSAFTSLLVAAHSGSLALAVAAGVATGIGIALVFAFFSLYLKGNIFIVGLATNLFAQATTAYVTQAVFGRAGVVNILGTPVLPAVDLPLIKSLPVIGAVISGHSALVYVSWICVALGAFIVRRTPFGWRLLAAGENPEGVHSLGLSVRKLQLGALVMSGIFCGLAGAQVALSLGVFVQDMTAGRGWIGLIAAALGHGSFVRTALASLLFGSAIGVANVLQTSGAGIHPKLVLMLPYIFTVVAFVAYAGRSRKLRQAT